MAYGSASLTRGSVLLRVMFLAMGLIVVAIGALAILRDQPHRLKAEDSALS